MSNSDLLELETKLSEFSQATDDFVGWCSMVLERLPATAEWMIPKLEEVSQTLTEMFQPYEDLAEGRINADEFLAQMERRHEADQEGRRAHYGWMSYRKSEYGEVDEGEEDGLMLELSCRECGVSHEWDVSEREWPPIYFQCRDITDVSCQDE